LGWLNIVKMHVLSKQCLGVKAILIIIPIDAYILFLEVNLEGVQRKKLNSFFPPSMPFRLIGAGE